ncbi:MAG: hypothetical protein M3355_12015 [Actinomycetota bacterium]|nr:hypothetical protein [Actinomycetota bacterium]
MSAIDAIFERIASDPNGQELRVELTAKDRKKLPASSYCGPGRSYPAHDASHARNCLSRASQQFKAGKLSKQQHDRIVACCRGKLGQGRSYGAVDGDALAWTLEAGDYRDLVDLRAEWIFDLDPTKPHRGWHGFRADLLRDYEDRAFDSQLPPPDVVERMAKLLAEGREAEAMRVERRVSSKALPGLDRSPRKNWIDNLPAVIKAAWHRSLIYRAAQHMAAKGMPVGRAIASAINWARHICSTGDVKQWPGLQQVKAISRAAACAALSVWATMKAAA